MTRAQAHSIAGRQRKALVALLVVGVHAWLLSVRLPSWPPREAVPASTGRVTVLLIPSPSAPATQERPAPRPKHVPPPRRTRAPSLPPAATPSAPSIPQPALQAGPGTTAPEAPPQVHGRGPITPDLSPARMPSPTLAERAQSRLGLPAADALQRGIESSARPDCREAYAGLGHPIIAIAALVRDALREDGCKW